MSSENLANSGSSPVARTTVLEQQDDVGARSYVDEELQLEMNSTSQEADDRIAISVSTAGTETAEEFEVSQQGGDESEELADMPLAAIHDATDSDDATAAAGSVEDIGNEAGGGTVSWEATQVRLNAIRVARDASRRRVRKRVIILGVDFPIILFPIIMVALYSYEVELCAKWLVVWLLGVSVLGIAKLVSDTILPEESESNQKAERYRVTLGYLVFTWFFIGNYVVFSLLPTCHDEAPHLSNTAIAIVAIGYVYALAPFALAVIALPLVCLCLPVILRLLVRYGRSATRGASQKEVSKLKLCKFANGMFSADHKTCAICLSDFEEGEYVRELECPGSHVFHKDCIDSWLVLNGSCPNCRYVVVGPDRVRLSDAQQGTSPVADTSTSMAETENVTVLLQDSPSVVNTLEVAVQSTS